MTDPRVPRPRRSQGDRTAQTRRRLVDAAIALLVEKGYGSATTAAIADRAGVTTGALHHHFGSKEVLFFAVLDASNERIIAEIGRMRVAAEGAGIARHSIDRLWKTYGDPQYWAVWEIILGQRHDAAVRARLLAHRASSIDRMFAAWMVASAVPPVARAAMRDSFVFALHAIRGLLLERMLKPDPRSLRRQLDLLSAIFEARVRDALDGIAAGPAVPGAALRKG